MSDRAPHAPLARRRNGLVNRAGASGGGRGVLLAAAGFLVSCLLILAVVAPGVASAEPVCSDSWTGPAEGMWTTGEDWCLVMRRLRPMWRVSIRGRPVKVTASASAVTGLLSGEGTVVIREASLEVLSVLEYDPYRAPSHRRGRAAGA